MTVVELIRNYAGLHVNAASLYYEQLRRRALQEGLEALLESRPWLYPTHPAPLSDFTVSHGTRLPPDVWSAP